MYTCNDAYNSNYTHKLTALNIKHTKQNNLYSPCVPNGVLSDDLSAIMFSRWTTVKNIALLKVARSCKVL